MGDFFPEYRLPFAEIALNDFLTAADWAASNAPAHRLTSIFQDATQRRIALRAVKALVPRQDGGIDLVELSGDAVPEKHVVQLAPIAANRILDALETSISETEERHEGDIREIDLDKRTFKLRNVAHVNELSCRFREDLDSAATESLGKRVRVIGIRIAKEGARGILEVVDIEKVQGK
jgi:hypothetical protein